MSAYPAQSYYAQTQTASPYVASTDQAAHAQQQLPQAQQQTQLQAPPSPSTQIPTQQAQHQPQSPQSQQQQQQQPQQPQPQQPYYYGNSYSQTAQPYSSVYFNGYTPTTGSVVAPVASTMPSSSDMAYPTTAYPPQYQYSQVPPNGATMAAQQPYQTAYLNSYHMQPYQYLQQQQQQQALYQQQYQHAYHHQQAVAMMPTITDPTGQKPPPNIKPKITTTLWEDEGTLCFQVEARGICVARREDNNMINGTKLLNVAGMTRGRRDGILKGEKNRHVVKAGAMHLKGVWIPYERALDFANREKIIDMLYPLFVTDLKALLYHPANFARTAQVLNAAEKRKAKFQKDGDDSQKKDSPKDEKKDSPQQPPSQQSLSGRFSVDRIVSNSTSTPSSTPPATTSSTPKPYYFNVPDQYDNIPNASSAAYVSPTSRISTPVSANQQQSQSQHPDMSGMQRYTQASATSVPYALPQMPSYGQMYQQAGDARVPLVSPASSTRGNGSSTPTSGESMHPAQASVSGASEFPAPNTPVSDSLPQTPLADAAAAAGKPYEVQAPAASAAVASPKKEPTYDN